MKTLIVYYSYGGKTKRAAEEIAQKEGADLCEAVELKRLPGIGAFFIGCPQAAGGKARPIHPLSKEMEAYEKIIIMGPIWAGNPAPAVNSIIDALPAGKKVEFRITSGGGQSKNHERTINRATAKGCEVEGYVDMKA
ncbi:MAG TPA: hypothetical protein DEB31_06710 [Clostridiales bacterium]|nr:hypothetical protein [Clostridiales bacterium]